MSLLLHAINKTQINVKVYKLYNTCLFINYFNEQI